MARLAATTGLVVIAAPAGYGTSTLLAGWQAADPRPFGWIRIGPGTAADAPTPTGMVAALIDTVGGLAEVAPPTTGLGDSGAHASVEDLARLLAGRDPIVVAVAGAHHLPDEVAAVLDAAVDALPPGSALVVAGRAVPALRLGRARVKVGLTEIGLSELRWSTTQALRLAQEWLVELDPDAVTDLVERTEGWPAAVARTLAERAGGGTAPPAAPAGPAGPEGPAGPAGPDTSDPAHRELVRALWLADLRDPAPGDGHPADGDLGFLRRAAALSWLSGPLCDAAVGGDGAAARLDRLARRTALVIPLDRRRRRFRLHRLLADTLLDDLARTDPEIAAGVRARASAWFETGADDEGDAGRRPVGGSALRPGLEEAITYAARSGDAGRTEALVVAELPAVLGLGDVTTARRWLTHLPAGALATRGALAAAAAEVHAAEGDHAEALRWLSCAEQLVGRARPAGAPAPTAAVHLALTRAHLGALTAAELLAEATYAGDHLPYGPGHATSSLLLGTAHLLRDGRDDAAEALEAARAEAVGTSPVVEARSLAHLAILAVEAGRWADAGAMADRARARLAGAAPGAAGFPATALVPALAYLVAAHAGRAHAAAADRHLARRHLARLQGLAPSLHLEVRLTLARADLFAGDRPRGRTLLVEAEQVLAGVPDAVRVRRLLDELATALVHPPALDGGGPQPLTHAELRVLRYLPTHLTLAEIGQRLYVSRNTAKSHAIAVYRKLGAASRSEAVDVARQVGLLDEP